MGAFVFVIPMIAAVWFVVQLLVFIRTPKGTPKKIVYGVLTVLSGIVLAFMIFVVIILICLLSGAIPLM